MKFWHRSNGSEYLIQCNIESEASAAARKALQKGQYDEVERFVGACADVNDRCHAIESLADWRGDDDVVERWLNARPSALAAVANGIHKTKWAWEARGGGYASTVSAEARMEFAKRLDIAKSLLLKATQSDPREASGIPWLIWISLGTGETLLGDKAFAEGVRRQPSLRAVYSAMSTAKSGRWGGSPESQLSFVRESAARCPAKSGVAALIVSAHDMAWEDSGKGNDPNTYWRQMSVVSEVIAANEACTPIPATSVNGIFVRQLLAYGLWRCGQFALAKPHFQAVGKGINEFPWYPVRRGFNWLFSPLRKARKECLRA